MCDEGRAKIAQSKAADWAEWVRDNFNSGSAEPYCKVRGYRGCVACVSPSAPSDSPQASPARTSLAPAESAC